MFIHHLKSRKILLFFLAFFFQEVLLAESSDREIFERIDSMEKEINELRQELSQKDDAFVQEKKQSGDLIEYRPGEGLEFKSAGLKIGAGATFVLRGTQNANGDNLTRNGEDSSNASYSVDLEFEKSFEDCGMAFLHLETGDGVGGGNDLKVFSGLNRDADDSDSSVSVTEVWYEHYFQNFPLTFTFGKIDPTSYLDSSEYANDECTQFLGEAFRNSPAIEFPDDSAFGFRLALEPTNFLDLELAAMDANANWENVFDDVFFSGQVNFKPSFWKRPGNYRVYGWLNGKNHISWGDSSKTKKKNYGFGLSFDQELTNCLGVFLRYGWQNPKVYLDGSDLSLERFWSAGFQIIGNRWNRAEDIFAFAFGEITPSGDYKTLGNLKAKSEKHFEVYYSYKANKRLSVIPDVQLVWDPYGGDASNGNKTIFVGGIRAQLNF